MIRRFTISCRISHKPCNKVFSWLSTCLQLPHYTAEIKKVAYRSNRWKWNYLFYGDQPFDLELSCGSDHTRCPRGGSWVAWSGRIIVHAEEHVKCRQVDRGGCRGQTQRKSPCCLCDCLERTDCSQEDLKKNEGLWNPIEWLDDCEIDTQMLKIQYNCLLLRFTFVTPRCHFTFNLLTMTIDLMRTFFKLVTVWIFHWPVVFFIWKVKGYANSRQATTSLWPLLL